MLPSAIVKRQISKKWMCGVVVVAAITAFSAICTCLDGTADARVSTHACCPDSGPASQAEPSKSQDDSCCHETLSFYVMPAEMSAPGYVTESIQMLDAWASATLYLPGTLRELNAAMINGPPLLRTTPLYLVNSVLIV